MSDSVKLTINVSKELRKTLKLIAIEEDTTVTNIVLELINNYLDEREKQ